MEEYPVYEHETQVEAITRCLESCRHHITVLNQEIWEAWNDYAEIAADLEVAKADAE